jgi:sugar phosphate isomerase/epimerase
MTRRTFTTSIGAAAAALGAPFPKPVGVQLYTARTVLPKDPEGTLKQIAAIGYREVELYAVEQIASWAPLAARYGMKATSVHIPTQISLAADETKYKAALDQAAKAGIEFAGVPYVMPQDRGDLDSWKSFCEKMNRAARTAKSHGLGFFYHHHAFEFAGENGKRPIDVIAAHADRDLVKLELDVFWAAVAGQDPVAILRTWKDRVVLMHVKDRAKGMATIFNERDAKPSDFKEVGAGDLNFQAILSTALATGVQKFYVEQDQTPGDPLDSLRVSFANLKKLSF